MLLINCKRCGKEIQKKGPREYCIKCRKEVDKEIQAKYREERRLLSNKENKDD